MEEIKQQSNIISEAIDALKNSKNDEEFNKNLKAYTMKLYEQSLELEKQKGLIQSLRNENRVLTLELAQNNIKLSQANLDNERLKDELSKLHKEEKPKK